MYIFVNLVMRIMTCATCSVTLSWNYRDTFPLPSHYCTFLFKIIRKKSALRFYLHKVLFVISWEEISLKMTQGCHNRWIIFAYASLIISSDQRWNNWKYYLPSNKWRRKIWSHGTIESLPHITILLQSNAASSPPAMLTMINEPMDLILCKLSDCPTKLSDICVQLN